jgi:hypothetical protein
MVKQVLKYFFGIFNLAFKLCDNIKRNLLEAVVNFENVDDVIDLKSCTCYSFQLSYFVWCSKKHAYYVMSTTIEV